MTQNNNKGTSRQVIIIKQHEERNCKIPHYQGGKKLQNASRLPRKAFG